MAQTHDDSLEPYFREAGRLPLLDAAAEVRLGRVLEAARSAEPVPDSAMSDVEQEERDRRAREGEEAAAIFVQSNLRLVVSLAMRYQNCGLALPDLIQEGNLGLMHAVAKYDWRQGFKFSSYATWWIRNAISRALDNTAHVIRLPVHVQLQQRQLRIASVEFEATHGRAPSVAELAAGSDIAPGTVAALLSHQAPTLSLDEAAFDDGHLTRGDLIGDVDDDPSFDAVFSGLLAVEVDRLLANLDWREREILRLRFGLDGAGSRTRVELAERFELSPARIRQLECGALGKLQRLTSPAEVNSLISA